MKMTQTEMRRCYLLGTTLINTPQIDGFLKVNDGLVGDKSIKIPVNQCSAKQH